MHYRYLGRTGLKVSELCLGTMTFGGEADEATSHAILGRFLAAVAKAVGRSPAQVALCWLLQRPGVAAPIIGARTVGQLDDNLGATALTLDEAQMAQLNEASDVAPPYPHDFLANAAKRR